MTNISELEFSARQESTANGGPRWVITGRREFIKATEFVAEVGDAALAENILKALKARAQSLRDPLTASQFVAFHQTLFKGANVLAPVGTWLAARASGIPFDPSYGRDGVNLSIAAELRRLAAAYENPPSEVEAF